MDKVTSSKEEANIFFPKASVKRIMKLSDEVRSISPEAIIATAKVTEDFLAVLAKQSREVCEANNRKTIRVDDILVVIEKNNEQFGFLDNMLILSDDIKSNTTNDDNKPNIVPTDNI